MFRNPRLLNLVQRAVHNSFCQCLPRLEPAYGTLARHPFSGSALTAHFHTKKKQPEQESSGFVDIHDIGPTDPKDYDTLITDVDEFILQTDIADLVGISFLQQAAVDEACKEVEVSHGFIYGPKFRIILPCTISFKDRAHWVFFIVDSGSPLTYLSPQTAKALGIRSDGLDVYISGYRHRISLSPEQSHFTDLNLLGSDFLSSKISAMLFDDNNKTVNLHFKSSSAAMKHIKP